MKIDLVTFFPGVVLETEKTDSGKKIRDRETLDELAFLDSRIISYTRFLSMRESFKEAVASCIDETRNGMVDQIGEKLSDGILVVDTDIDWEAVNPPNSECLDLLTYFFNLNYIHRRVGLDSMKAILFPDGKRYRYANDRTMSWIFDTPWRLPIRQDNQMRIKLRLEREQVLAHALEYLHGTRRETYRKMMTALGLFNESCRLNVFHPNSSVVLIVSALEALFGMPKREKKEIFAYTIQLFWGFEESIKKWAQKLYDLRSNIVHGSVVGEEELKPPAGCYYSYYEIARKIFDDCLRFTLETHGAISIDSNNKSEVKKRLLSLLTSNEKKIKDILGQKLSYRSFEANEYLYAQFVDRIDTLDPEDDSARNLLVRFLQLAFSIVQDWIESDKEQMESRLRSLLRSTGSTNTTCLLGRRMGKYDEIMRIIGEIRKIPSWSTSKLRRPDERSLREQISCLHQEATEVRAWFAGSITVIRGELLEIFLTRCLRAAENMYRFGD